MKYLLAIIALLLTANTSFGQYAYSSHHYPYSSHHYYLSSHLNRTYYPRYSGSYALIYRNLQLQAYININSQRLKSLQRSYNIRLKAQIKAERKLKIQSNFKLSEIDREQQRLDDAERKLDLADRRHRLKQRRQELIRKGALPKPKKRRGGFHYSGNHYKSWEDFEGTLDWARMKWEMHKQKVLRRRKEENEEKKRQEGLRFEARWRKMSYVQRQKLVRRNELRKLMGNKFVDEIEKDEKWIAKHGNQSLSEMVLRELSRTRKKEEREELEEILKALRKKFKVDK